MNFFDFFRSSFNFLLYFFYWLYTLKMAPNQRKTDFLENRWFLAIFVVLKIASKGFVHTLESRKGFVHTNRLRDVCIQIQKCVVHTFYFLRTSSPNPIVFLNLFYLDYVRENNLFSCWSIYILIVTEIVNLLKFGLVYFFDLC